MPIKRKRESRDQRRYTRSSTHKGIVLHRPVHLWRILAILLVAIVIIAAALIWGSYLKAESDAYRAALEKGEWTLNQEIAIPHPVDVPDLRAIAIKPEGNVGDILIAGEHEGVILPLKSEDSRILYDSSIGLSAGLTVLQGEVSLVKDVTRVQKRGLRVTCAFTVSCFSAPDAPQKTYQRGLELALLREFAEAGMNDILLFGLPAGDDSQDQFTVSFLQDLRRLLSELPNPPAIGVALPITNFTMDNTETGKPDGTDPLYAGNITPARILSACDYISLDLRNIDADTLAYTLPHIQYAYVRYSLRLLLNKQSPQAVKEALGHGFDRIFEMDTDKLSQETNGVDRGKEGRESS